MTSESTVKRNETAGLMYGALGVVAFGFTLPATRIAVADLDPTFVGLGRELLAGVLAALLLLFTRQARPTRAQFRGLLLVAAGVGIGFPLLSAWALRAVPSNHGAIMLGILPLATAIAGVVRAGERPSRLFWVFSAAGSMVVLGFALWSGGGSLHFADMALVGAVFAAALGYAEGGRLARELGSWQVICWALVIVAPVLVLPVAWTVSAHGLHATAQAWLGFGYVSLVSAFLGFFAWYRGLALGGIARVGQLQLLQPFVTLGASAVLLDEAVTPAMLGAALLVAAIVAFGRKAAIQRPALSQVQLDTVA